MRRPRRTTWRQIDPALRAELEAILDAHRRHEAPLAARFHSDADEFLPFVLLALLASVGGVTACAYLILSATSETMSFGERLGQLVRHPPALFTSIDAGLIAAGLAAVGLAVFLVRHLGRHGFAITDNALVVVRGPRLRVLPYTEVARTAQTKSTRFTALELTMHDGRRERLIVSKGWADAAEAAVTGATAPRTRA